MYKWISVVAIGSAILSNRTFSELKIRPLFDKSLFEMTEISSVMNIISYDYDWMPNLIYTDDFNMQQHVCHSIDQLDTLRDVDKFSTNQNPEFNQINTELNQYYSFVNEMPMIETMNEIDYENCENEDGTKWKDKLKKHRKTSNFGFTSLQKRIERVKNDIINLTNKLNAGIVQNGNEHSVNGVNTYYNLGFGNMVENEPIFSDEDNKQENEPIKNEKKTWKCPSQFNSNNPYAELSENTQKILNRLHLNNEEIIQDNKHNQEELEEQEQEDPEDDDFEMEEDEIEFSFTTNQNGLLQEFLSKGTLPIIEEEDETDSSNDEDDKEETYSTRSVFINNLIIDTETINTPKTLSLQSMDFTESESYITALTNPEVASLDNNDKSSLSFEDAEENFSDYARYSVSSHSSKESLNSCNLEKLDNETITERTLINHSSNMDCSFTVQNIHNPFSSMKLGESSDSDAEYDNSTWSNEDILQSIEQSDSMYEKPAKSSIKSSLPNLIETSDNSDLNEKCFWTNNRNLNKSTDLDEIMEQIQSPCHESSINRLSLSLCNLNSNKSDKFFCPKRFFQDSSSNGNLLETDLDSGFVSIYQPIKETEILPSVDFSCSMVNINQERTPVAFNSLAERLRSKAGSIPELRVANSLNKLNVPDWLNSRSDDFEEILQGDLKSKCSIQAQSFTLPSKSDIKSPIKQITSLPRQYKTMANEPSIKPQLIKPVILPSQKFRQMSQKSLTPIKTCRAREFLTPTKVALGTF